MFVGDDPRWDVYGARRAGITPLLIDRTGCPVHGGPTAQPALSSLAHLSPGAELSLPNVTECTRMTVDADFRTITEQVLGSPLQEMRTPGAATRFFSAQGTPAIISRPVVGNVHRVDEWIDIDSMLQYYRILHTFISRRLHLS